MSKKIQYRTFTIDRRVANQDKRTVPATLSSEHPVQRYGGTEVLSHAKGAINLERATQGLPLLFSHNPDEIIGRAENIKLTGRKLRADLRFSNSAHGNEVWQDVTDGILTDISIGYRIDEFDEDHDVMNVTAWTLVEASVTTIPADHTVGINRSFEMGKETQTADDNVVAHTRWLKQEKQRRIEVRQLFEIHTQNGGEAITDLMNECLDDPAMTAERSSKLLLTEIGKLGPGPLGGGYTQLSSGSSLSQRDMQDVGANRYGNYTARDTLGEFADAAADGLLQRGGVKIEKPHPGAVDVRNMRMSDIAETMLRQFGVRTSGMSRDQLVRKALSTRGFISHSSSDFPALLENIAEKSLLQGFNEVPAVYRQIARIGSLPDFKQASRVALSDFTDLEIVYENGEYKYGTFSDLKETLTLETFGKMFSISRQALVNDDLGALVNVPRGMASAAARVIDDKVINVLINNAALNQDSTALFHADHNNLVAPGSGAAPSVSAIDAGFVAMAQQTGPQGAILDIVPSLLIVPVTLDATARIIVSAMNDPAGATFMEPNPFQGRLEVVSTARLDADDPLQWYLSANPNVFDTIEVAFLDNQTSPYLETKDGWNVDGVEYKVRLDCVAAALDFRGLYQNDGN